MTQQFARPIAQGIGVAQGLQGLQGEAQRQQAMQQQMQAQQQQAEAQAAQQANLQQKLQGVVNPETGQLDPQGFTDLLLTDPDMASTVSKQFGVMDEARATDVLNKAFGLKQMLDTATPEQALQMFQQGGYMDDPLFAELADNLQSGDIEGAQNELRYGIAAVGGPERFAEIYGEAKDPKIGTYNPRDYTTDSFAEFTRTGDASVLERYSPQRNVEIGGVPHVFDPNTGGYMPAQVGGGQGAPGQQETGQPGQQPAQTITPESVGATQATLARMEAEAKLPSQLLQQGLQLSDDGSLAVVPGSQLDRNLRQEDAKAQSAQELTGRSGQTVIQDLGRAMEMIDDSTFAAGAPARMLPRMLNRPAQRLQSMIDSIESNISVNSLNEMRQSSPTGGALGNVSDKQSALLAGLLGNMDITQDPEDLTENMKRVQNIFLDIVHGLGQGPERNRLSFDHLGRRVEGGVEWQGDPRAVEIMREDGQIPGADPAQRPAMSQEDADALINSILGGQ